MEKEIIRMVDNGVEYEVEVIDIIDENGKKYILYTKGENDANNNHIIYVSILSESNGDYEIEEIENEVEYQAILKKISTIISEAQNE